MHGFISCLPERAEYPIPWNSCFQKYYLASQPCSLQKGWCWRKGQFGCAIILTGQLEFTHQLNHVKEILLPSLHKLRFLEFLRFKISLSYFYSSVFFYTYKLKKKKSLSPARPQKKRFDFQREVSLVSQEYTALLRAQSRPRLQ